MTKCYECNTDAIQLSPRSRCIECEHRRAMFNEAEIERLRYELHEVKTVKVNEFVKAAAKTISQEDGQLGMRDKRIAELEAAMQLFVDRVDVGEVSVKLIDNLRRCLIRSKTMKPER